MNCERYYELLSARLDRELTREEAEELELHLVGCPKCRIVGEQMAEAREAFAGLEDIPAPQGFAQGVMDRIRAGEARPKVVPLFQRPQFRVLAGLAACAALVIGLYRTARPNHDGAAGVDLLTRSVTQDALTGGDTPMITAYDGSFAVEALPTVEVDVLALDRMPEGAWELIPPETPIPSEGLSVTRELLEQIERLAREEGITASRTAGAEEAEEFRIVVLDGIE